RIQKSLYVWTSLVKKIFQESDPVPVGTVFALIEIAGNGSVPVNKPVPQPAETAPAAATTPHSGLTEPSQTAGAKVDIDIDQTPTAFGTRFYSPLVRSIALQENIPFTELDSISGSGKDDRLTKQDLLDYLRDRKLGIKPLSPELRDNSAPAPVAAAQAVRQIIPGEDRIVEMDRIRQLISNHMIKSVQTSAHVTSFQEVDMTRVVQWREKNKESFQKREKEKLTFTPVFIEAIAKALRDYPMVNVSVDGTKIIVHSKVNVGMAVALPSGNLIVPVVGDSGSRNLLGITRAVNDLANRARNNKLVPDEISGGTISLTNLGSFGTLMGTPIINQPQTAIIAVGAIKKRPVVIESEEGDMIAIRPVMICSITFDHRVIDGGLGGQFLSRFAQYLEQFDNTQTI
ncbi:MAG: dihydrolipoamide acetyltransferase family protein, partial [Bacteroidota bacterium]